MTAILALNAGSSSLKFALYEEGQERLRGQVSDVEGRSPSLKARRGEEDISEHWEATSRDALADRLVDWISGLDGIPAPSAIGHRVVHGGRTFDRPVRIDAAVLEQLDALTPLAPLHQPASLAPIRQFLSARPELPQVACFDTAFHHGLVPPASRYPLPRALEEQGIRRYGFHGLSYEYIAGHLAGTGAERQRVIVAHLGSGASLCAMRDLRSIDTTMGFTALDGIMMGTRPGALDAGILLYLLQEKGFDAGKLEHLLYHESGLAGVSGLGSDVNALLGSDEPRAGEALDLFAFSAARAVAALAVSLDGLDRLVFTGGIGEHAAPVRARIADRLGWLGVKLDDAANGAGASIISPPDDAITVQVIATDEECVIAHHTRAIVSAS